MTDWFFDREVERRREARKSVRLPATAFDPQTKCGARVEIVDMSRGGARLRCADPMGLPDRFRLFIAGMPAARRECLVVRRTLAQVGVAFHAPAPRKKV